MPQMIVCGPFEELELPDQFRPNPATFPHLLGRKACFQRPLFTTGAGSPRRARAAITARRRLSRTGARLYGARRRARRASLARRLSAREPGPIVKRLVEQARTIGVERGVTLRNG